MHKTVVALFDEFTAANDAVRELVDNGFERKDISLIANDTKGAYTPHLVRERSTSAEVSGTSEGASVGAGMGAVIGGLGGLLVGLGALTIPGIGPVIAAGPLAAALSGLAGAGIGAVAGGVTGGLLGALVDLGIPSETAGYYAEGIRQGGTLVTVRTDDTMADQAVSILNRHGPVDINDRATQWRESGWTSFDESRPYYERGNETPAVEGTMTDYRDFGSYEPAFRTHYSTRMADYGGTYEEFQPAYRYGYDLAHEMRYHDYDWDRLEPEARLGWEERHPGSWDHFKMAVRHAWEELKAAVD